MKPNEPAPSPTVFTVLSIDDTPVLQTLIRMTLEFAGIRVLEATSGHQGLSVARTFKPDLIVLDLVMPGMDGKQVFHEIMADSALRRVPVIVVSASDDSHDIETCLAMGAKKYLVKPFLPQQLIEVVRQLLPVSPPPSC